MFTRLSFASEWVIHCSEKIYGRVQCKCIIGGMAKLRVTHNAFLTVLPMKDESGEDISAVCTAFCNHAYNGRPRYSSSSSCRPSSSFPQNTRTGSLQPDATRFDGVAPRMVASVRDGKPVNPSTMLMAGTSRKGSLVLVFRALKVVRPPLRSILCERPANKFPLTTHSTDQCWTGAR